jgi:hypothetical protein
LEFSIHPLHDAIDALKMPYEDRQLSELVRKIHFALAIDHYVNRVAMYE